MSNFNTKKRKDDKIGSVEEQNIEDIDAVIKDEIDEMADISEATELVKNLKIGSVEEIIEGLLKISKLPIYLSMEDPEVKRIIIKKLTPIAETIKQIYDIK